MKTKLRGVTIKVGRRVYAVGIHPRDVPAQTLLARYYAALTCTDCGNDKGSLSMPCPYCHKATSVPQQVSTKLNADAFKRVSVPSATTDNLFYTLVCAKRGREVISCSCPSFRFRRSCRHKTEFEAGK